MKKFETLDKLGETIIFPDLYWSLDVGKMYKLKPIFECKGSEELLTFSQTLIDNVLEYDDGSFVLSWFNDDKEEVESKEFDSIDQLILELKSRQAPILLFHVLLILTNKYNPNF